MMVKVLKRITLECYIPRRSIQVVLFCICIFHLSVFHITVAQKTSIAFKGNGRLQGPTRVRVTTGSQWIQQSLDTHNFFRSLHGSPPLQLNNTLSEISQYYANYLLQTNLKNVDSQGRIENVYFKHNSETGQAGIGENLYYSIMTAPVEPIPSPYAVLLWYEEIKDYDFSIADRKSTSDPEAKIGHLTQLLWKSTSQMGTAYASSKLPHNQTIVFVVANYFRQGNLVLRGNEKKLYLENVLPPTLSVADINSAIVSRNVQSWWKEPESESSTSESWRNSALADHNYYRNLHGAQPLRLNKHLCKVSQLWANYLVQKGLHDFSFYGVLHQVETNFFGVRLCKLGETSMYFLTADADLSAEFVLKSWYSQSKHYDFLRNQKSTDADQSIKTDGFEQIVWNSTTEFCMSYATKKADNGQYLTYVTANYYPSLTNIPKDRKQNVFPRLSDDDDDGYSVGTILLIVFIIVLIAFISVIGSMYLLFRFKLSYYESIMKTVRLKK